MKIKVGRIYEPPEQDPVCHVRRKVLSVGERSLGTEYIAFMDLIEYRGVGVLSREEFEAWLEGRDLSHSVDGGDD